MKSKITFVAFICFSIFVFSTAFADSNTPAQVPAIMAAVDISASNAEEKTFKMGSANPERKGNPYKLELELTSKGAAVMGARLRDYDNRDRKNPQPLELLSSEDNLNTMASTKLLLPELGKAFPLDRLNWVSDGVKEVNDTAVIIFSAVITKDGSDFIKLTKTYSLKQKDYLLNCTLSINNLSDSPVEAGIETLAAAGIDQEDQRSDTRGIAGGFVNSAGAVEVVRTNIKELGKEAFGTKEMLHKNADYKFLWIAHTNKYFAVIARPVPTEANGLSANWITGKRGKLYDPDGIKDSKDEKEAAFLTTKNFKIAPAGTQQCDFQIYIGPKDRDLFIDTPLYNKLGFIKAIDFQACMGDTFSSLSFAILAAMNWMNSYIGNYGVVIIIFVFIVRVLLHPITKKSQVSMMKMSKLGPKAEEIKQKYAGNKAEMQKQLAMLYREQGATPILGCLPMFLQMPIWIALYSAIYAGIEFRGAEFLPFWITDLSSSDTVFKLPSAIGKIPFIGSMIGDGFNLLPILLGAAMFAQQKLMPSSASASTNPQMAQQQKMMLWMMPIMMLIFLYKAPSGLNLYIMASTTAGVVEQYVIRKHIREKEEAEQSTLVPTTSKLGGKLKKKKPKPPIKFS